MRKHKQYTSIFLLLFLSLVSCDDIFVEDIASNIISPISPLEGDQILGNSVNFQWSFLEGADSYRLQILSEDANTGLVIDSLVTDTSLNVNVPLGTYAWSVRGENFGEESLFFDPINFEVLFSDDLASQNVQLLTPTENFFTNTIPINFNWSSIEAAESYNFRLQRNLNGVATILEENVISTSIQPSVENFMEDAEYVWAVNAMNSDSETAFVQRSVFLDRSIPETATLLSPDTEEMFDSNTISFSWSLPPDTGNIQSDRERVIEFSQTDTFDIIVDSFNLFSDSTDVVFNITGEIFWRVRVEDLAGNNSDYSLVRSFTIN